LHEEGSGFMHTAGLYPSYGAFSLKVNLGSKTAHPMQQHLLTHAGCTLAGTPAATSAPQWLDCTTSDAELGEAFAAQIAALTGIALQPLHAQDAANALHPSHYDGVASYDMVVFRGLIPSLVAAQQAQQAQMAHPLSKASRLYKAKHSHRLQAIVTQPTTFFISDHCLITVQHSDKTPLAACLDRVTGAVTPHQLMLRFINAQVDAYLELRQPLTEQLDRWQRELLDPRRAFDDWTSLLDARLELRKLESLSEEQMDALNELREAWLEPKALPYDTAEIATLRVRLTDICEHIERVLNHAKRLESSVESAIQLHFAAVAHQTNHTVRNLTILTAVFAPLTLITGFYGMNVPLPAQTAPAAWAWIVVGMVLSAAIVLSFIFTSRFLRRRRG
jgi:magnesium transporter